MGLADALRQLRKLAAPHDLPIASERPSDLPVDTLVAAGHPVVPIHPNVVKACRPRYLAAGKTDAGDAYLLADVLRTDGHRFRPLAPRVALANQRRRCRSSPRSATCARLHDDVRRHPTRVHHAGE